MKVRVRANNDLTANGKKYKRGEEFTLDNYDDAKDLDVTRLHTDRDMDKPVEPAAKKVVKKKATKKKKQE